MHSDERYKRCDLMQDICPRFNDVNSLLGSLLFGSRENTYDESAAILTCGQNVVILSL